MSTPAWNLILTKQPEKLLKRLPRNVVQRIDKKLNELETNPWPDGCVKLSGYDDLYRVRVGDWRIIYAVENDELIVLVLEISTRGGAYRNLDVYG